ncbi:MAG: DUF2333 family protein [Desulfobacterales bacterium]
MMKFLKKKNASDGEEMKAENGQAEKKAFPVSKRMIIGMSAAILLLGIVWTLIGFMGGPDTAKKSEQAESGKTDQTAHKTDSAKDTHAQPAASRPSAYGTDAGHGTAKAPTAHAPVKTPVTVTDTHGKPKKDAAAGHATVPVSAFVPTGEVGLTFMEACMKPMNYEINERFWGWRPNDIIEYTDNVNNFQLGVLEVTRRTAVALAENISRTGSTDAYVPALELAMNWFMVKPSQYWFPSAESKYQEGLDEMKNYMNMLRRKEARFYRRVDNVVPLFRAYESILGSCDENMVKELGEMSFFRSDDLFYYTKGVATAMGTILEAAAVEFHDLIASAQGTDLMHHAIVSLEHASHMDPWIVLESKPDSLLANHRANMAAPISHARFYISVLNNAITGNVQ